MSKDRDVLLEILKEEAYFNEKIILSSGKESDYYIDARLVTLSAGGAYYVGKVILDMIKDEKITAIGGPTLGADPMVGSIAALSFEMDRGIDTFIIRKAPKSHGKQQQVEGPLLEKGKEVIIIDDVATTGKAFLQSIDVLRAMDIVVKKAICIVDRDEGAKEALAEKDCELVSIFSISDFR